MEFSKILRVFSFTRILSVSYLSFLLVFLLIFHIFPLKATEFSMVFTGSYKVSTPEYAVEVFDTTAYSITCGECALWCNGLKDAAGMCSGFTCNQGTKSCDFYRKVVGLLADFVVVDNTPQFELQIFGAFHTLTNGGNTFYIYVSDRPRTQADAIDHCNSFGAHLLQVDSQDKMDVAITLARGIADVYTFVDGNDIVQEGTWVTDRDGTEINRDAWFMFSPEPNGGTSENCAAILLSTAQIVDTSCLDAAPFLCERDGLPRFY